MPGKSYLARKLERFKMMAINQKGRGCIFRELSMDKSRAIEILKYTVIVTNFKN